MFVFTNTVMADYIKIDQQMYPLLKYLGRDHRWNMYRPTFKGGNYDSAEIIGKFKVEIDDSHPDYERIFIWNPKRPCIEIDYDKNDNYAALNTVEYDPKCTVDGQMKRGSGTKEMIEFTLELLKKKGVEKVQLMDNSTVICDGMKVSLKLMYFFKYGETWYEKHFGFKPTNEYAKRYNRSKELRKEIFDTEAIKDAPCEHFKVDQLDEYTDLVKLEFHPSIIWEKVL